MTGFDSKRAAVVDKQEPPSEWASIKTILDEYGLQAIDFVADFKAALAQPAQEPVAEVVWGAKTGFEWKFKMLVELACVEDVPVKLYAGEFKGANVYWHDTTPPQRLWVGLTPEETSGFTQHEMIVVKYVSKVLQEKNT